MKLRNPARAMIAGLLSCGLFEPPVARPQDAPPPAATQELETSITVPELQDHVRFLASDTLEGREAGTQGSQAAAAYIVDQLKAAGVKPLAADGDYFHLFDPGFRNIVAAIPGSDDRLREEFILIGAHYDHVGYGTRSNSRGPIGVIHNGADDNASGTAGLLEVAEALRLMKTPPRRSVLVVFWDGEEKGLLGSKAWVAAPAVPLQKIRLHFNADMIGRLRTDSFEAYGWRTATGLREFLARENSAGLPIVFPMSYVADSDHWPFFEQRVPSVMLHTGKHDDYHRPGDDFDTLNFDGMASVSKYLLRLTLAAAAADTLPAFRPASHQEHSPDSLFTAQGRRGLPPSRLGVAFNTKLSEQGQIKLIRIVPDSAAAEAGLKVGDEIVELDGKAVKDVPDFRTLVASCPTRIQARVRRGEETLTIPVTLRGEPLRIGVFFDMDDAEPGVGIVTGVRPGSPADRAGLKREHRLLSINGQRAVDAAGLQRLLTDSTGPMIQLEVEQAGRLSVMSLDVPPVEPAAAGPDATRSDAGGDKP